MFNALDIRVRNTYTLFPYFPLVGMLNPFKVILPFYILDDIKSFIMSLGNIENKF